MNLQKQTQAEIAPVPVNGNMKYSEKIKRNEKEAEAREDWEGGASRPSDENVPDVILPPGSPGKDLQKQAEKVPKTNYGDSGPPKNLQSLPTQNTHEVSGEEAEDKSQKNKRQ